MDYLHQIKLSLSFYLRAIRFVEQKKIWSLLIIPAIINFIIAILIVIIALKTSDVVSDYIFLNLKSTNQDQSVSIFLAGLLLIVVRAIVFFIYLKVYRYLLLICLAPSFAFISAKIQLMDSGLSNTKCPPKYLTCFSRGMKIAIRNFLIEVFLSTLIIIISILMTWLIPIVPIVILLMEGYFMGFSMADYRNEYHKMTQQESTRKIHSYLGLILGNGVLFNIFLIIPVFGILFAPPIALIASGLSINYVEKRKNILCDSSQSTLIMAK